MIRRIKGGRAAAHYGKDYLGIKNWRLWLGVGVSGIFLLFLVWTIDLKDLRTALAEADYLYVAPAIIIYFAGVFLRSARWRYILSPLRRITAMRLYPVVVIGYAANNVLPARAGEFVRAYYLAQREQFSGSTALATIGVERIYDGLTLFILSVIAALLLLLFGVFGEFDQVYRNAAFVLAGVAGAGLLVGLTVITYIAVNPRTERLIDQISSRLPGGLGPRLRDLALKFVEGLSILSSPKQHGLMVLYSLPVWAAEVMVYLTVAYSFGIDEYFASFGLFALAIVLVTATSNLSTAFPVSIGGIGPFELIAQQTLAVMGVDWAVAASYALVVHLVALWLPVNLAGLALMWKENLSLKQLAGSEIEPGDTRAVPAPTEERTK